MPFISISIRSPTGSLPIREGDRVQGSRNWKEYAKSGRETHPVVNVSWNDRIGILPVGRREASNRSAVGEGCRGTDGRDYPWGNARDGNRCNCYNGPKVSGMADIAGGRGTARGRFIFRRG